MTQARDIPRGRGPRAGRLRRHGSGAVAAVLFGLLSACSTSDEPTAAGGAEAGQMDAAAYAEASPYPNLAGVPDEAPRPTPESLRKSLMEGLIADRQNARYTTEALTAETAAVPPAPAPPKGRQRVDITWESPRVLPEGAEPEEAKEGERIEVEWNAARVEPAEAVSLGTAAVDLPAIEEGGTELLAVIRFPTDAPDLDEADRALLRDVLVQQKERGGLIHVVSHGGAAAQSDDPVAQRLVDLDLSLKRANAVAATLVNLGASQDKLLVEAKTEGIQAAAEASERKVEIFLEY